MRYDTYFSHSGLFAPWCVTVYSDTSRHRAVQLPSIVIPCVALLWFNNLISSSITAFISITVAPGCGTLPSNIARHRALQMCQHAVMHMFHLVLKELLIFPGSFIRASNHCSIVYVFWSASRMPNIPNKTACVQLQPKVICSLISSPPHIGHSTITFGRPLRRRLLFTAKVFVIA